MRLIERKALKLCASLVLVNALVMLAGCGERVRIATPPVEYLTCDPMPDAPELPPQSAETQRARDLLTLGYILALRTAYGSCAGNVAAIRAWSDEVGE